ncbi:MAG: hypothetical protein N4A72_10100 [Bacteroidales bacterium]|jgi:hypothetical protein|nr:hypothetical protein [Bacteroidales bacterium]
MKFLSQLTLVSLLILSIVSCKKDDDNNENGKGDILISNLIPNPDGVSGSAYMQLISNVEPKEYDNQTAFPASYGVPPVVIGKDIYLLPGWSMLTNKIEKYSRINGELVKQGQYDLNPGTGANAITVKGNKAYVSLCMQGKILILDHTNMTKIGEIDLSKYGEGDNNPDPAISIIRDDLLYVGLNQLASGQYNPDPARATADVLIIDTKTDKPLKKITKDGFSMATKPEADDKSIFMDEKGDIYINCISGFGFIGHGSGMLRIKKGETEFDDSYALDITKTTIPGINHKADYLINICYAGNGIMYATANINALYSKPEPNYFADMCVVPLKIDIYNKTVSKISGIPMSCNFGFSVNCIGNQVFFGLATKDDKGFYSYNPATDKASTAPVVKVKGYPGLIYEFK